MDILLTPAMESVMCDKELDLLLVIASKLVYVELFLRLVPDLTTVIFPSRQETPTLGECFAMLAISPRGAGLMRG